ncbi:arylsulfatase [Rudanella lutea]|uniref:arylsulfatase n=1 Tax=Rudanella lutea TaxID=451374 RepID=UPI00037823C1|nr:arylsulfatase [Rudanella lutea]
MHPRNRPFWLLLPLLLTALATVTVAQQSRPNIIYIMADDLGYGDLGCYGQQKVKTPNLDRMARQGIRFTRFYAGSTVCAPSRCALMTGKHMGHAYVRGNGEIPLRDTDTTLAQRLQANGYKTGMFGKWGLGLNNNSGAPQRKGWDEFTGYLHHRHAHNYHTDSLWQVRNGQLSVLRLSPTQYTHDVIMDRAFEFLQNRQADKQPFFLYLPITLVHAEMATTDEDARPILTADGRSPFPETPFVKRPGTSYSSQQNPKATFAAMLSRLDKDVGKLLELLKQYGMDKNTYVFFTSDNGPHREGGANPEFFDSNGPLRGIKRDLYEGGIRVPMIALGGRVRPGKVSNAVWANWDISPTICALTRTAPPRNIDGLDMSRVLMSSAPAPANRSLFWQFDEGELRQALLQDNWKLVRLKKKGEPERLELYDLGQDEGETTNLAASKPDKVAALLALMKEAQTPTEHPQFDWSKSEQ